MSDNPVPSSLVKSEEVAVIEAPDLDRLFSPGSVAVIGASASERKAGGRFVERLLRGFGGAIYPVNPGEKEIWGLKAYPTVLAIPGPVDLAVLAIPSAGVPQAVEECAQKGVRFAIIHTAGFAEVGEGEVQARIVQIARSAGLRLVGPNCMGVMGARASLSTMSPEPPSHRKGEVAIFSQSGTMCQDYMLRCEERGVKASKAVSCGNEADLKSLDYLGYFARDPEIRIIVAYMEEVRQARAFWEMARRITTRKPVIIWKAGKSPSGARAALSHTAALAGRAQITEAALRQAGVVLAHYLEEMVELTVAFTSPYLPRGRRVGIIADSGGGAVSAADACEGAGLEVPPFSPGLQQQLRELMKGQIPPFSGITNPIDLVWAERQWRQLYMPALELISREVDSLMLTTFQELGDSEFLDAMLALRNRLEKPFFFLPSYATWQKEDMRVCTERGIPAYPTPYKAAQGLSSLVRYARYLGHTESEVIV